MESREESVAAKNDILYIALSQMEKKYGNSLQNEVTCL